MLETAAAEDEVAVAMAVVEVVVKYRVLPIPLKKANEAVVEAEDYR